MHTSATSQVRGDQPRIRCSISFESDNQPPLQLGIPTVSIIAPATAASNFGGVVTLHRHRDINKYMIIVHYYINAFLSSSSLLSLLLFFYYYYYHFFLGGCRFKKTFQKTTDVKDNVKVNIILCYFFFCLMCVPCFLALVLLKTLRAIKENFENLLLCPCQVL